LPSGGFFLFHLSLFHTEHSKQDSQKSRFHAASTQAPKAFHKSGLGEVMTDTVPMTEAGFRALKDELQRLKSVDRPAIILQVAEARAHGDLSENAEYAAARERHGFIEGRIALLEGRLARAQVIDTKKLSGDKVVFGATVTVLDSDTELESIYTIVGDDETNLEKKHIGISTPVARALIGKSVGDEVEIRTPKGLRNCEVMRVVFTV
jgi:transcription elongation factor GreA